MGQEDWPQSRERLLEDIEAFSQFGAEPVEEPEAPQVQAKQNHTGQLTAQPVVTPAPAVKPLAASAQTTAPTSVSAPAPAPAAASSSLLSALKQKAEAKRQTDEQDSALKTAHIQQVSTALGECFRYLNDLTQQLNVLKPAYGKAYTLLGFGDFTGLFWQEGRADYRMQENSTEERLYDQVTLRFRLASTQRFSVTREHPTSEKLRKTLFDNGIAFEVNEVRNDRGFAERSTFSGAYEVKAGLLIAGDFETGKLTLRMRNIERFGMSEYQFLSQSLNAEALDELVRLMLGEANQFNQKFQRTA